MSILIALAFALALRLPDGTPVASASGTPEWTGRVVNSAGASRASAAQMLLAHLDEESVPSAENADSPNTNSTTPAPDANPAPADDDWERLPAASTPSSSDNPANGTNLAVPGPGAPLNPVPAKSKGPPPRTSATDAHPENPNAPAATELATSPNGAGVRTASLNIKPAPTMPAPAPVAPAAGTSSTPAAAETNNSAVAALRNAGGDQPNATDEANLGPPPALDLGAMESSPDLASASLNGEIKKAGTPARAAALRVTEQARVELGAGKTDDAIRDLGRAVSIDPGNPFEYFYLGRAYIARRNYAQALTFLQRAEIGFSSRPDWLGAAVGFEGNCYEELGRNAEAALAYQRALGTAPNNLTARVGYSRLASYLPAPPSPPSVDAAAETGPSRDPLPPPHDDAAAPAPVEPPAPPPPASNVRDSAPAQIPPADSPLD